MFGFVDRRDKACQLFCVKDNRTKESLLPLIKANVLTTDDIKTNNYNSYGQIHNYFFSTRVYSDCFVIYQKIILKSWDSFYIGLTIVYDLRGVIFTLIRLKVFGQ